MKIGGVPVTPPSEEILVLPREPESIVFRAVAVPDMDEFSKLCPPPKPPGVYTKDGWVPQENDEDYLKLRANYEMQQLAWLVLRTLEPSEIEWQTVDMANPATWKNWQKELREAGLTSVEVNKVVQLVMNANMLNEDKLAKAREVFLRGRVQAAAKSCSPSSEQPSSPSGEPA